MHEKLSPKTLEKRLQDAQSFYLRHVTGIANNLEQIRELLVREAPNYRRNSWRNLRGALVTFWLHNGQPETAKQIAKIRYPSTLKNKPKPQRVRRVSDEDFKRLVLAIDKKKQNVAMATLLVAKHLGCRPSEMNSIEQIDGNKFLITSSKKTAGRGLDRVLESIDEDVTERLTWAVETLQGIPTRKLQNCFEYLVGKAFPARLHKPTIYSFRHQLGSNLKNSGLSREIIAYVMGHQSTQSVERYGDSRSGRGGRISVRPAIHDTEILALVRTRHYPPPNQSANDEAFHEQPTGVSP